MSKSNLLAMSTILVTSSSLSLVICLSCGKLTKNSSNTSSFSDMLDNCIRLESGAAEGGRCVAVGKRRKEQRHKCNGTKRKFSDLNQNTFHVKNIWDTVLHVTEFRKRLGNLRHLVNVSVQSSLKQTVVV